MARLRFIAGVLLGAWLFLLPHFAPAQAQLALPQGNGMTAGEVDLTSPEAIREAVSQMSDAEVRKLLLERLDAVAAEEAAAEPAGNALIESLTATGTAFVEAIAWALEKSPNIPGGFAQGFTRFYEPRGMAGTLHLIVIFALAMAAGFAAEWLTRQMFGRLRERLAAAERGSTAEALGLLGRRFLAELLGLGAFFLAAWLVIKTFPPPERLSYLIMWFFLSLPVFYAKVTAAVSRFVLAPSLPQLRLVHTGDWHAKFLHRNVVVVAFLYGMMEYSLSFLGGHGVDLSELRLRFWLSSLLSGYLLWIVWQARAGLTMVLAGNGADLTRAEAWVARAYPYAAMVLILMVWALVEVLTGLARWDLLDGRLGRTLVILLLAPALDTLIRWTVRKLAPPLTGEGEIAERAWRATHHSYIRIGRVIVFGIIVLVLADTWNLTVTGLAMESFGARFAAAVLEVLGVLITGYLLWEIVVLWINRKLAEERGAQPSEEIDAGGEGGGAGGSRLSTVLPILSWALQAAIVTITALVALGAIGIDTTPLLAGAGIVGLAVGFGAQKLVADVVAGIFFLVDDAFRTGEYVEVEGTYGTVEKISIRSLILRHHEGAVHTIPFGEIPKLTNYSRDWVIMKLRFTVPFDTDLMKVKKLFKQIGKDMMAIPEYAEDFLQPFKSQGVLEVDDVGIVIRGKFMAKPGRQWVLRKEIYARVQKAFEENGLQFARKEVRVKIDGDAGPDGLTDQQRQAIGSAAAEAAEAPAEPPAPGGTSAPG